MRGDKPVDCKPLVIGDIVGALPSRPGDPHRKMRSRSAIRLIVVHYDAVAVPPGGQYDPEARYREQASYHIAKNWNEGAGPAVRGFGLMYHYRVSADGRVWRTQPEELITWHARQANNTALAICCDLGPGQAPTEAQLEGLEALLDWLCYWRPDIPAGRADVWGHGELRRQGNSTECPGSLLAWVNAYRARE